MKNVFLRILNDLDSAGRGKKRDEEGGTKGKEGREGRRDGEEGGTRKVEKMKKFLKKDEKVAKRRIIGLAGPCYFVHDYLPNEYSYRVNRVNC